MVFHWCLLLVVSLELFGRGKEARAGKPAGGGLLLTGLGSWGVGRPALSGQNPWKFSSGAYNMGIMSDPIHPDSSGAAEAEAPSTPLHTPMIPGAGKPLEPPAADDEGPVFFDLPAGPKSEGSTPPSEEKSSGDSETSDDPPSLDTAPPPLPTSEGKPGVAVPIPGALDDLPGMATLGGKMGNWALLLGFGGVVIALLPWTGFVGAAQGIFYPLPLFFLAFVLAVVSFFKKPSKGKSIVALVISVFGPAASLLLPGFLLAGKASEMHSALDSGNSPVVFVETTGKPASGGPGGVAEGEPPVDGPDAAGEVADAPLPPELRPVEQVVEEVIPPEERRPDKLVLSREEIIFGFWRQVEKGFLPDASFERRNFAGRVAQACGYPYDIFLGLGSDLRYYVIERKLTEGGIDLERFAQVDPSLGVAYGGPGALGDMSSLGNSGPAGQSPGPLPSNMVSEVAINLDQARNLLISRGYGTRPDGVGKFMDGMNPLALRKLLQEALAQAAFSLTPEGGKVYEGQFRRQVGWDPSGLASVRLQVHVSQQGVLTDAFPY
jgi:hypothetical protein